MLQLASRTRLFETIDPKHLPPIILVTAPAGCGKTVFTKQLTEFMGMPVVWHSVDEWQADGRSLHQRSQTLWQQQQFLSIPDYPESPRASARQLCQAIQTKYYDTEICYVIDDIQHLIASSDAEQWLQSLIDHCPDTLHLIFVGRKLPTLNWYQVLGQGKAFSFDKNHLRLDAEDIQEMTTISEDEAESLCQRYNGWATAIRLALDTDLARVASMTLVNQNPEEVLFEQLAINFFKNQSLHQQHLLLVASSTQNISLKMCQEVFELKGLQVYLEDLYQKHLLLTKSQHHYHLHDLFRAFLQNHLKENHAERYHYYHLRVAQWYEADHQIEQAISHYIQADAKFVALGLAEAIASELHVRGLWQRLLTINQLLANELVPRLQLFASLVLVETNKIDASDKELFKAKQGFLQRQDADNVNRVSLQQAHNQYRKEQYQTALLTIQSLLDKNNLPPLSLAWAYRIEALCQIELGAYTQAITNLGKALVILKAEEERGYSYSQIMQDLSVAYIRSGQFSAGISILQEVLAIVRSRDNLLAQVASLNNLGISYKDASQYEDAITNLERAKSMLPDQDSRVAIAVYHSLGDLYRDLAQFSLANYAYDIASQLAEHYQSDTAYKRIMFSRFQMALWRNDLVEAQHYLQNLKLPLIINSVDDRLLRIWQEVITLWKNSNEYDLTSLNHQLDSLQRQNAVKALSKVLGSIAYLAMVRDLPMLLDKIQTIIGQLPDAFLQPLVADCFHQPQFLRFVQNDPILWQAIRPLYDQLSQATKTMPISIQQYPHQLELKILGQDQVIFEGNNLKEGSWASPQARAFFYCLYFYGNQNKDQLTELLWRNHSTEQARNALRDVRKRIKDALPNVVLYSEDSYQLNPDFLITSDAREFESLISRAQQLPNRDARTEELFLRAISLYKTHGLLPNLYVDCLQTFRLRYELLYLEALDGAATSARSRHDYLSARHHYEQILLLRPYDESIYCKIMTCLAQNKQFAQIQLIYNRLEALFRDDLKLEPQAETLALLNRLLI